VSRYGAIIGSALGVCVGLALAIGVGWMLLVLALGVAGWIVGGLVLTGRGLGRSGDAGSSWSWPSRRRPRARRPRDAEPPDTLGDDDVEVVRTARISVDRLDPGPLDGELVAGGDRAARRRARREHER
jgi:hypothetical protein